MTFGDGVLKVLDSEKGRSLMDDNELIVFLNPRATTPSGLVSDVSKANEGRILRFINYRYVFDDANHRQNGLNVVLDRYR